MYKKNIKCNYQITLVLFVLFSNLFCFDKLVGIMVDFIPDDDPQTSGDGTFLSELDLGFINYENKQKCSSDNFLVESPPHNTDYFLLQMKAVQNYYESISNNSINFDIEVITTVFTMDHNMKYYSTSDSQIGLLFSDAIDKVYDSLQNNIQLQVKNTIGTTDFNNNESILFVVFHAGLGQESSTDFDPTIYDIRSAFVDETMLEDDWIIDRSINRGIVLPETLNMIYYDTIEDNIPISDDEEDIENVYCNSQFGMSGLFSYLLGYSFGFPPLHNFENGQTRVGSFDLMDVGFFNGRGVIPSSPSAWIRSNNNFDFNSSIVNITSDDIGQIYQIPSRLSEYNGNVEDVIYRFDISNNEYFLIEHRSNLLDEVLSSSIDVKFEQLRNDFNDYNEGDNPAVDLPDWFNIESNFYPPGWFDVLINEFNNYIEVDSEDNPIVLDNPENNYGIITKVTNYDAGLPGSGLLIWHINEPSYNNGYAYGINDDILNKAITLEEGDGSQDIGELNPGIIAIFENEKFQSGKADDFWYSGNSGYIQNNNVNDFDGMFFNSYSFPNNKSVSGVPSNLSIEILPNTSGVPSNIIQIQKNNVLNTKISDILILEDAIDIIGNDGDGCVFYLNAENSIFRYCDNNNPVQVYFSDIGNNQILATENSSDVQFFSSLSLNGMPIEYPEIICYQNQSYLVDYNQNYYYNEETLEILNEPPTMNPKGFYDSDLINNDNINPLAVLEALSLANFDEDAYDEKLIIANGNLDVKNYGNSSINGFPVYGFYKGNPLVLNIFDDYEGPEIIAFNSDKIDIISSKGEVVYELPVFTKNPNNLKLNDLKLSALKWNESDIALVNGNRLYIFDNAYDVDNSFWMNSRSRPSNYPLVTGSHGNFDLPNYSNQKGIDLDKIYNYPNPINNNRTTFRFFVFDSEVVEINIFDITGYNVARLYNDNLISNEFNELEWESINLPIGLYFASVKSDQNQAKILKVVVE